VLSQTQTQTQLSNSMLSLQSQVSYISTGYLSTGSNIRNTCNESLESDNDNIETSFNISTNTSPLFNNNNDNTDGAIITATSTYPLEYNNIHFYTVQYSEIVQVLHFKEYGSRLTPPRGTSTAKADRLFLESGEFVAISGTYLNEELHIYWIARDKYNVNTSARYRISYKYLKLILKQVLKLIKNKPKSSDMLRRFNLQHLSKLIRKFTQEQQVQSQESVPLQHADQLHLEARMKLYNEDKNTARKHILKQLRTIIGILEALHTHLSIN